MSVKSGPREFFAFESRLSIGGTLEGRSGYA